ncbi:hypothetical protein [Actinokineospora iranica]|uniref:Lipoprotein LpqN n=1 Tax=Actinokineospora iranica TaxID=1271860 RepID=A0A1G6M7Y5_9PSEU|nr:hypothetical protein [Actinokineospora iranica]SDC51055.1 hypothetical protein SAMN05216174_102394 [Actinokineospora iranica]
MLLVAPKEPERNAQSIATYDYADSAPPARTGEPAPSPLEGPAADPRVAPSPSKVALPVPEGYQRVAGPGGIVTTIPDGWIVTRSSGPGAMQATDPADPTRFIRYGGAPAPAVDLVRSHVDYERAFAATRQRFQRLSLGTATYHGVQAVDWEFEHDTAAGRLHVHSMYWRVAGTEYFLYATSTVERWAETAPVYRTMVENVTP